MKKTELIFGRHAESKTQHLLEKMKESLDGGRGIVIIMPQNQSLYWEKLATAKLDKKYANDIEIVSFPRLADSVFRTYGGIAKNYINDAEKSLLMWNAILSVNEGLKVYGKKHREDRYVETFLTAVSDLKMYGVSAEELSRAASELEGDGALCGKLSDLALIYSAYTALMNEKYFDPEDIYDALCEKLREHNYFQNKDVFIDSFHTLSPKEMRVTECILANAENVYITITQEDKGLKCPDEFSYGDKYVGEYVNRISALAERCGHTVERHSYDDPRDEVITKIWKGFFNYNEPLYDKETDRVTIIKCNDRYDEATLALTRVKQLAAQGARYSEIALVCSSLPKLYGIFDTEAEKAGVPVYTSEKHTLSKQAAFKFIVSALNVIAYGWKKEYVVALAKSGFCSLTEDECNAFEKYVNIWNINTRRMFTLDTWEMNPAGLTEKEYNWEKKFRELANSAKAKIIPKLTDFVDGFKGDIKKRSEAVFNLLCDFKVFDALKKEAIKEKNEGELAKAKEITQIWPAICSVLDTVCKISGSQSADAKRYISLISKCADKITIGYIPDGIEKVVLGSVDNMRLDSYKHIILLGASAGEFPLIPSENDYFSEDDKVKLEGLGIVIGDKSEARTEEAIFRFKYAASSPEETLTVMVPTVGKKNQPSIGTTEIMRLFNGKIPVYDFCTSEGVRAIGSQNVSEESIDFPISADEDRLTKESADAIYNEDFKFSNSVFESFMGCPYKFFNEKILKLSDDRTAAVTENILGTFVHSILEGFMKWAAAEDRFPLPEAEVDKMVEGYAEDYIKKNCPAELSPRSKRYFDNLTQDTKIFARSINLEFSKSKFRPIGFEVGIGRDDSAPALEIPLPDSDKKIRTNGYIDRVDIYYEGDTAYVRVVDYKTGSKEFSLAKAKEGKNFQMLYYLFSLTALPECELKTRLAPKGESIKEAGVIYLEMSNYPNSYAKEDAQDILLDSVKRIGVVLQDDNVSHAMDESEGQKYLPKSRGKNIEIPEAGFIEAKDALIAKLGEIGAGITGGDIRSNPEKAKTCEYCNFNASCRHCIAVDDEEEGGNGDE